MDRALRRTMRNPTRLCRLPIALGDRDPPSCGLLNLTHCQSRPLASPVSIYSADAEVSDLIESHNIYSSAHRLRLLRKLLEKLGTHENERQAMLSYAQETMPKRNDLAHVTVKRSGFHTERERCWPAPRWSGNPSGILGENGRLSAGRQHARRRHLHH